MPLQPWFTYLLLCADGSLYCGATNDLARRLAQHQAGQGARFTRSRGAVRMVWAQELDTQGEALRLEAALKKQTRRTKLKLANLSPQKRAGRQRSR